MEEHRNSGRSWQLVIKSRQNSSDKIQQLHDTLQGYFTNCNQKRIDRLFPIIDKTRSQLQSKQKQLLALNSQQLSQQELQRLEKNKRQLIKYLQEIWKKVSMLRDQIAKVKINRDEKQKQLMRNQAKQRELENIVSQQEKKQEDLVKDRNKSNRVFPRVSKLNFELLNTQKQKRYTVLGVNHDKKQNTVSNEDRDNFFTSATYLKLKQLEKLIDEITIESPTKLFESYLIENNQNFNFRKVFRNFGIQEYFDEFVKKKKIGEFLIRIQNN